MRVLALVQDASVGCWIRDTRCGMLDSAAGHWIWAAGWGARPHAARSEGASEQPGAWRRAAMRGCWEGVGGPKHPLVSLLPSPSCCGCLDFGFTALAKRKQCRGVSVLVWSPILQPSTLASLWRWGLWPDIPLLPPPPPHPMPRISLTRQQRTGTTGICGKTGEGCSPSWLERRGGGSQPWDRVQGCRGGKDQGVLNGPCCWCTWGAGLWGARPPPHPCHAPQRQPEAPVCSMPWELGEIQGAGQGAGVQTPVPACEKPSRMGRGGEASARGQARRGPQHTRHALLETSGLGCGGVRWLHMHVHTCMRVRGRTHAHTSLCVSVYQ